MNKKEILEHPHIDKDYITEEVIDAYIEIMGGEEYIGDIEDAYCGEWKDDEEFAQQLMENCGDIPSDLPAYIHIDWEKTARDIMMDYSEEKGHYFRNL